MSEAQADPAAGEKPKLDEVILYLLAKQAEQEGYKIPISDVHQVLATVEGTLRDELHLPLSFHQSSQHVHSQQIEQALADIIPYKIPVRNPSFSLEISERIGRKALDRTGADMGQEYREILDQLAEDSEFQRKLRELSTPTEGG